MNAPVHVSGSPEPEAPRASLADQAYTVLRRAIRDGVIGPDRYYSESELGELLGVSRTPVREALKGLERDGAVEAAPHRGYRLRTIDEAEIEELVEVRQALERLVMERLIERIDEAGIDQLAVILAAQGPDNVQHEIFTIDEAFHLQMAEFAGLPRTRAMLAALRSAMAIVTAGASVADEETEEVVRQHAALLAAIRARDTPTATALLEAHIDGASRSLLESSARRRAARESLRLSPIG